MRYYIDEKLEMCSDKIKEYILNWKDSTRDTLLDEILTQKGYTKSTEEWKEWKEYLNNNIKDNNELLVLAVEERFYFFEDEEEHSFNKQVVENFINGIPSYNRWTNEVYG